MQNRLLRWNNEKVLFAIKMHNLQKVIEKPRKHLDYKEINFVII